ncbi:DUF294 nucleotidyltransferase-like domain-containing protein, partial [Desulfococcaceae bacterium HSG8]|nr:DUF294 nucleotidyltransferase-like domain-containing protein [Desulfococcaceae bacterium HSG8]
MKKFQSVIKKLAEETERIASESPSHRITFETEGDFSPLVRAINILADRYEAYGINLQPAFAETEEEKDILAAFMSELPEGVLICNAEGQLLLYNKRARQFLGNGRKNSVRKTLPENANSGFRLGQSVFAVIDKNLIEHALDEINEKLKRNAVNAVSHFIIESRGKHILQTRAVPILNRLGQFTGFILILSDITRQREADNRVDSLLKALTRSARSPLASIRSAIEAILEYPDMDKDHLRRFREIIHKESIALGNILNRVGDEYSALIKTRWSLTPLPCKDLMETIGRRAKDRLDILVHIETYEENISVKADSYSMIIVILFILNQLKNEVGISEVICKLGRDGKFINLDLTWQGDPLGPGILRKWEDQFPVINGEQNLFTVKEVLEYHRAEIWSHVSGKSGDRQPCIRFLLPADETGESESFNPVTILPESAPVFYDFDLFNHPGQNPELDNRLLTELTYTVLIREISETQTVEEVIARAGHLPRLIHSMISDGARMRNITWLITTFSDAILKKLVGFGVEASGPPPVNFAFVILGSEGRKEQTLKTDQDNAIIFEDEGIPGISEAEISEYFLSLAEKVCTWLDQAGYAFCTGNIMARNLRWCQSMSVWKRYFSEWIHTAEHEHLLHSTIFFDFRFGYGDERIVENLREHLFDSLTGWSGFFRYMAENTVSFRPPVGFLGNFLVETKGKHRNCLDIKRPMTQIVDFARIYALRNNIRETNT